MELKTRDDIIARLSLRPFAIYNDRRDLLLWMKNQITDQQLVECFRKNNKIEDEIPVDLMIEFARSLDYPKTERIDDGEV